MNGRQQIEATALSISFSEQHGYRLTVRVTSGPQSMLDRRIIVQLTSGQLDAINDWDPNQTPRCDLTDKENV
jgi:hypothetical protein